MSRRLTRWVGRGLRALAGHRLVPAVATAGAGLALCAFPLVDHRPGVRALAGVAALTVLVAVVSGWRLLGLGAALLPTAAVVAAVVDPGGDGEGRAGALVGCAGLLLLLVVGLDRCERGARAARVASVRLPAARGGAAALVLGVGASAAVAAVSARPAVPSVTTVLVGLAAAVAALTVATRPR